ncbi:hypothetical protein UAY_02383 [Enterococcus moraviensis ATCC BAA-383]|uniref:Uncharacterized protein n=1 Tax=Enterococcus moraviensis ATCC BAA-383 TaxID=1158609 RepID=R2T065_9ENTE|nr:hypothetical protein [Enterococcus moraviensis]EOH98426.1 hypothetical protein UAY_02383 [Enterococcus moraviensis ATCC BAA-383]EOT71711.1 hypothetical protein I586_01518 [Enterococcus moraviensis ATCC BAA-383]OJG67831.1 hypothetical protein RV09_GL001942 [Enterococcus moraviensis]
MFENPFEKQINELKEGTISELIIEPKDFTAFREVWKNLPDRMSIVGEAGLNGRIIYRYIKEEE